MYFLAKHLTSFSVNILVGGIGVGFYINVLQVLPFMNRAQNTMDFDLEFY